MHHIDKIHTKNLHQHCEIFSQPLGSATLPLNVRLMTAQFSSQSAKNISRCGEVHPLSSVAIFYSFSR